MKSKNEEHFLSNSFLFLLFGIPAAPTGSVFRTVMVLLTTM